MAVDPDRWGVIYNPKAGTKNALKRWEEIRAYMQSRDVQFDYVHSEGFGSVERLSKTMANNGYKTIVVVGGDGALNDAVNGIMYSDVQKKTDIALGIIPNGIGNDFAKFWGLNVDDFKMAVDTIVGRRLRKVDVGVFRYPDETGEQQITRYFLNAVYVGLGARMVIINNETKRFWGIPLVSYMASLVLVAFERKLYRSHIKVNGEHIRGNLMAMAIGNARGYGLTPSAVPYNGWLDVSLIYRPELRQLVSGLWMLQNGRFLNHKTVKPYRSRKIKILRALNAEVSLDGRLWLDRRFPIEITVEHEAMSLVIPK